MKRNNFTRAIKSRSWFPWLILGGLLTSFIFLILAAPAERTLGEAIRYVYLHVALIQAGMLGLYLVGFLGLILLVTASLKLQIWAQVIARVGFSFFIAGGIMSVIAANATWGGFPIDEPRNQAMLSVIALSLIVLILGSWLPWIRVQGFLYLLLAVYVYWSIPNTPLVLHPGDAGGMSPSATFRLVFVLLPLNSSLIAAWFVWFFAQSREKSVPRSLQMGN